MNQHALIWIIVTITIIVVMMALMLSYMNIIKPRQNENYWPEPYFMGGYTQNDRERYFDYNPLPAIYRIVDFGKKKHT